MARFLLTTLIAASILLAILEGGSRLLAGVLGISPYMQYDSMLGWTATPNTVKRHRDRMGQFDVVYRINERGFRGPEYPVERRRGVFRIAVLGDSTGFGWGVAEERTFWNLIDREMEDVEVINLALSGYGIDQSYLRFIEHGIDFKPDLVVLQVSHNDFEEIMHPFFNQKPKPHFRMSSDGSLQLHNIPPEPIGERARAFYGQSLPLPFKEWLGWNSYAFNLLNEAYVGLVRKSRAGTQTAAQNIYTPQSIALFNGITRLLASKLELIGARGIVVFSAKAISTGKFVADDDLQVLDLYPAFRDAGNGDDAKCYFPDGYHWNVAGHRVAADNLRRIIDERRHGM